MNTDYRKLAMDAKNLAEKATEGPWVPAISLDARRGSILVPNQKLSPLVYYDPDDVQCASLRKPSLGFIAASRTLVPQLADAVLDLEKELSGIKAEFPNNALQNALNNSSIENAKLKAEIESLKFGNGEKSLNITVLRTVNAELKEQLSDCAALHKGSQEQRKEIIRLKSALELCKLQRNDEMDLSQDDALIYQDNYDRELDAVLKR